MKAYWKKLASAVLALALCIGSMAVGVSAAKVGDYSNEEEQDFLDFFQFDYSRCPHEKMSDEWVVKEYPNGETPGAYVRMCEVCGTPGESLVIPALKISAASLVLTDSLAINYKVKKSLLAEGSYTDPYIVFEMAGEAVTVRAYEDVGENLVFAFEDIAPHLMNETVTATLYATCYGKVCAGQAQDYSVETYCYNTLSKYASDEYAKLRTLLVDLLNYGAASQRYTGRATEDLVNNRLTAEQSAWGTQSDRALNTVQDTGYIVRENASVTFKSVGLFLQESAAIRFKIDATNVDGMYAKVVNAHGVYTIPASQFTQTDGGHYIYFDRLTAAQMSDANYITIYNESGAISNTFSYSVESYAYSMQKKSDKELLLNLISAMMRYGDAAKAYVGGGAEAPGENWTGSY